MSSDLVPAAAAEPSQDSFEVSLDAEKAVEITLMRSITKCIVIGIPVGILFFMALLWLPVDGDTEWYVIIGLGCGLGLIAAVLFGMLAGMTLNAHAMEAVDRGA